MYFFFFFLLLLTPEYGGEDLELSVEIYKDPVVGDLAAVQKTALGICQAGMKLIQANVSLKVHFPLSLLLGNKANDTFLFCMENVQVEWPCLLDLNLITNFSLSTTDLEIISY